VDKKSRHLGCCAIDWFGFGSGFRKEKIAGFGRPGLVTTVYTLLPEYTPLIQVVLLLLYYAPCPLLVEYSNDYVLWLAMVKSTITITVTITWTNGNILWEFS
jgi:hypothetical protein